MSEKLYWAKSKAVVLKPHPCYVGFSVTFRLGSSEMVLTGRDLESVIKGWDEMFPCTPINESLIQRVAIFSENHIQEKKP